jgi:hypothetical protein
LHLKLDYAVTRRVTRALTSQTHTSFISDLSEKELKALCEDNGLSYSDPLKREKLSQFYGLHDEEKLKQNYAKYLQKLRLMNRLESLTEAEQFAEGAGNLQLLARQSVKCDILRDYVVDSVEKYIKSVHGHFILSEKDQKMYDPEFNLQ